MRQGISFTQYFTEHLGVSVNKFLTEAKFRWLTDDELKVCADELEEFKKNDKIINYFSEKQVRNAEYGHKYYVKMKNPFYDTHKFSATFDGDENNQTRVENEEYVECIGIADKFGRIFLQNVWEKDEPAYIEYKKPEVKVNASGYKYKTKEGWYITRKKLDVYNVKTWYSGKYNESPYYFTNDKISHGVWGKYIDDDVIYVIDLSNVPSEIYKINKQIAIDKEAEEKLKQAAEDNKKFWGERKDYKYYGLINTWGNNIPKEVQQAWSDKDAKWFTKDLNNSGTYYEMWSDKYKLYYRVDSSD